MDWMTILVALMGLVAEVVKTLSAETGRPAEEIAAEAAARLAARGSDMTDAEGAVSAILDGSKPVQS
jgi:hypothetical protein